MIDDSYDMEDIINAVEGGVIMALSCTLYLVLFGGFLGVSTLLARVFKGEVGSWADKTLGTSESYRTQTPNS